MQIFNSIKIAGTLLALLTPFCNTAQIQGFITIDSQVGYSKVVHESIAWPSPYNYAILFKDNTQSPLLSTGGALSLGIKLKNRVSISMGIGKTRRGIQTSFSYHNSCCSYYVGDDTRLELDYVTAPIQIQVHFLKNRNLNFTLGIIPGQLFSAAYRGPIEYAYELDPIGTYGYSQLTEYDVTETLTQNSLVGMLGVGYEFHLSDHFSIPTGFNIQKDFNTIGMDTRNSDFEYSDLRNVGKYITIGLTYTFIRDKTHKQ